ncbi:MAG: DUF1501 domain-containing protein [Gemmataceae bacterium]|nr:DUF1501 domain-containing protein [Gemmataceae bacterium]
MTAPQSVTRRGLLRRTGGGLGALALTWLLGEDGRLVAADGKPALPLKATGKAKSVILLHMGGGPSQVDTFDPKPALTKYAGQNVPDAIAKRVPKGNERLRTANLHPSPFAFKQYGRCGLPVSDLFREVAAHAGDLCLIRSMRHDSPIHTPADYLALTGSLTGQRPSLGSWFAYGLGSENQDLPAFVAMVAGENFSGPPIYGSGFLPPQHQATVVKAGDGLPDLGRPAGTTAAQRRGQLDLLATLNRQHLARHGPHDELDARIGSYEMAFRMQAAAPPVFDLKTATKGEKTLYGLDDPATAEFGTNCLLARRLVERGVRFVQLIQGGWDAHGDLKDNHAKQAKLVDKPIAGLLADLKAHGLLGSTLVVWGGEFGRTPTVEGDVKKPGRDHNPAGYCVWLAGGGVKGGQVIGATDEVGYTVAERPVHPNDLHATVLHAFGLDQHTLWYEHSGRKEIVTNLGGEVVKEVFG